MGEWGLVILAEPKKSHLEMFGQRDLIKNFGDGFDFEVDLSGGFFSDDAGGGAFAEGNLHD